MKKRQKLLTDEQWELMEPLLPEGWRRKDSRGAAVGIESGLF
jgi:transposase